MLVVVVVVGMVVLVVVEEGTGGAYFSHPPIAAPRRMTGLSLASTTCVPFTLRIPDAMLSVSLFPLNSRYPRI